MNIAIILAGGIGSRMGDIDKPKQYLDVYGKPLIIYTMEAFNKNCNVDYIAVVCKEQWKNDISTWVREYKLHKVKWFFEGGETRQESSYHALKSLREYCNDDDIVLIHDAARPLVSQRIISENIEVARKYNAVNTVIPTNDTIIRSLDSFTIHEVPVRSEMYLVQTPQSFKYSVILEAFNKAMTDNFCNSTDDCQLVFRFGKQVHLVQGDKLNFKITTFEDIALLKAYIKMEEHK
ncbi:MAG: 2-C-methyl-D-erythritol 4-phosphate cytidylyltransferase [Clostridiaceae bacterium]|jgi:2-C-methyl-D-erythritol 4-phosphate cytidylyltransferase|nr:2-C-methyl-D-erythritol 4-phosphate cytidylyltransferase [Clostridiaceae bacterium]